MARKYQLHGAFPSKAGDSAYEVALKNGFVGTEKEWLASLVGPEGPKGDSGADAPQEAILYTPQSLTPEQQAQARKNIGACNEEFVRNAILEYDTEAMALLGKDGEGG